MPWGSVNKDKVLNDSEAYRFSYRGNNGKCAQRQRTEIVCWLDKFYVHAPGQKYTSAAAVQCMCGALSKIYVQSI
jgi:hypothetical protein